MLTIRFNSRIPEYGWLSNMYPARLEYAGVWWTCSESAYQAAKCANGSDVSKFAGLNGFEAKKLARRVPTRSDWDERKLRTMTEIVSAKFNDPELLAKLVATGDAVLVEHAPWETFSYWGEGSRGGLNKMGDVLMRLREEAIGKRLADA